jgi:nitrite reductase/ring-hydroxylating ferredoxin subunit
MNNATLTAPELVFVCPETDVPRDGTIVTRAIKSKTVAVARRSPGSDTIVAFDSRCPHMQGPLRLGRIVEGEVICPWHFFRFDTVTGQTLACGKTVMKLTTYPVTVADGKVFIQGMS